jgi:prepilin-type N-terminal cleavage/methylation domain-containing protein
MASRNNTGSFSRRPEMKPAGSQRGFSLLELMIGVCLSTLLLSGVVQLVSGSVSAYRLQLGLGQMQDSGRYARHVLLSHIGQSGFQPQPWLNPSGFPALTAESVDGGASAADRLGLQRWSRQNCYGNANPVTDSDGRPAFYLLRTRFSVNASNNLAFKCEYGPDASSLQTQVNNFGLVEDVESLQVLYAEDRDGDGVADGWVKAGAWLQESNIRAVRLALLLSTQQAFDRPVSTDFTLLDQAFTTPADGHLRSVWTLTAAIRGRLR